MSFGKPLALAPAGIVGARTWLERELISALRTMLGAPSVGSVLVHATGADVVLPGSSYALPIIRGATRGDGTWSTEVDAIRAVKTASAATDLSGEYSAPDITITSAGVVVPVISMLGGPAGALPGTVTQVRWDPPVPGIEAISTLTGAMPAGAAATFPGFVRSIVGFDELGLPRATATSDAWRAKLGELPALVVGWIATGRGNRPSPGTRMRPHRFKVWAFSSTFEANAIRRSEAKMMLDWAEGLLEERGTVDGNDVAYPTMAVIGSGMTSTDDGMYVYFLDIEVQHTASAIDYRTWQDWTSASATLADQQDPAYPPLVTAAQTIAIP